MERIDSLAERYYKLIYALLLAGGTFMYLLLCVSGKDIWADEAYTFAMLHHSFSEIWAICAADVHPALYYSLLKLFSAPFQYSYLSAKIFSVIPFVLILAVGGVQIKKLFDSKTALLFMALFLLFLLSMKFAVEIRMYSIAALFVFLNAIYAYRCWREATLANWLLFALFGVCAAYTHYFALVSAGIIYGLLLLAILIQKRELLKHWLLMSMLTILAYLPWLKCFFGQMIYKVNNEYWIRPITVKTVLGYVYTLFDASGITGYSVFFGLCYAAALGFILLRRNKGDIVIALSALAVPVCTVGVGVAASVLIRPVFMLRYIVPSIPLLVFFMAFAVGKMRSEFVVSLILTVALMGGMTQFYSNFVNERSAENKVGSFVTQYGFADAYVFWASEYSPDIPTHMGQVMSYYDPVTPIYQLDFEDSPSNPYPNLESWDKFDMNDNSCMVFFISSGSGIPEEFTGTYEAEKINVNIFSGFDAYLMTAKGE